MKRAVTRTRRSSIEAPHRDELRRLYHDERLSLRELGRRFGVSGTTASRWLEKAGVQQGARGRGVSTWAARQAEAREAAQVIILEQLAEIPLYFMAAAAARVHPNTLANWRRQDEDFDIQCQRARMTAIDLALEQLGSPEPGASATAARWLEKVMPYELGRSSSFVDDPLGDASTNPARVEFVIVRARCDD